MADILTPVGIIASLVFGVTAVRQTRSQSELAEIAFRQSISPAPTLLIPEFRIASDDFAYTRWMRREQFTNFDVIYGVALNRSEVGDVSSYENILEWWGAGPLGQRAQRGTHPIIRRQEYPAFSVYNASDHLAVFTRVYYRVPFEEITSLVHALPEWSHRVIHDADIFFDFNHPTSRTRTGRTDQRFPLGIQLLTANDQQTFNPYYYLEMLMTYAAVMIHLEVTDEEAETLATIPPFPPVSVTMEYTDSRWNEYRLTYSVTPRFERGTAVGAAYFVSFDVERTEYEMTTNSHGLAD